MSPTSHFFRAARPAFRARQFFRPKQSRFQSTTAGTGGQSWAKRMWESPVGLKTVHFWYVPHAPAGETDSAPMLPYVPASVLTTDAQGAHNEVGPRPRGRLRFCAPGREALADAERGADRHRPDLDAVVLDHQAQELSVRSFDCFPQNTWAPRLTRHSLAAVNFFLGIVGIVQVTRIGLYHQSQKALAANPVEEAKEAVKSA